jgi:chromosome segregation ATPase
VQLADLETRLAAAQAEAEARLRTEQDRVAEFQRRADGLEQRLSMAERERAELENWSITLEAESQSFQSRLQQEADRATAAQLAAEQAHSELITLQSALADVQARLAAANTQHAEAESRAQTEHAALQARLQQEAERATAWERRSAEVLQQLAAAGEQLDAAEGRLAEQCSSGEVQQRDQSSDADAQAARAALEAQLNELSEATRFERESWHHDRERLHQECRMLGHRLIQKQKELDEVHAKVRAASHPAESGQMTITMDQIQQQMEASAVLDEQRTGWLAEKERLERRVIELQEQISQQQNFSQQMTLGPAAVAQLQLEGQADQSAQRIHELETQLQELRQELAAAHVALSHVDVPAGGDEDSQLAQLQVHHEQGAEDLAQTRQMLAEERARLAAEQQQSAADREQLALSRAEFDTQRQEWEDKLRDKEQLLNRQAEELLDRMTRADSRLRELDEERAGHSEQQIAIAAQLVDLERRRAELDRRESECESRRANALPELPSAVDEVRDDAFLAAEPASRAVSPMHREQEAGVDEQALDPPLTVTQEVSIPEHCAAQFAGASPATSGPPQPVWTKHSDTPPPADDDSIEAYMSRLLKRVRGDGPAAGVPAAAPPPPPAPATLAEPEPSEPMTMTMPANIEPVKPEEYLPRNKAPEASTSLAAMRELANSVARTAVVKHQRKSGGRDAMYQSVGALLTLVCSIAAAGFAYRTQSVPTAAGAIVGLLATTYWGGKAARNLLRAMMLKAPTLEHDLLSPAVVDASVPSVQEQQDSTDQQV